MSIEFEIKNLGGLKYFLGIDVARSKQDIFLFERKYVLDLLPEVGILECKSADILIVRNYKLGEYSNKVSADKERYLRLVGKLIFLSHTHPGIIYIVSVVRQFMYCPSYNSDSLIFKVFF